MTGTYLIQERKLSKKLAQKDNLMATKRERIEEIISALEERLAGGTIEVKKNHRIKGTHDGRTTRQLSLGPDQRTRRWRELERLKKAQAREALKEQQEKIVRQARVSWRELHGR